MSHTSIHRGEQTSNDILHIYWDPIFEASDIGDSQILSYNIQYDQGTNTWVTIVGDPEDYPQTEVLVTQNIVANTDYRFRIRAKNVLGYAQDFSHPEVIIKSSGYPGVMPSLNTEYDTLIPTSVKISWAAAFDNYETIDAYQILIKQADGTFTESLAECDGSDTLIL
jgi:hypothetical protein